MATPQYPVNLIPRPFANNGTFQVIPDTKPAEGRASWQEGFPVETQLPLNDGGIAPSRPDFNGIFNALSALAFWQQAGGLWVYDAAQDYNTPAVIFFEGSLWFCAIANGPSTTTPGIVTPGTDATVWVDFFTWINSAARGGLNPVGTVIMYAGITAPTGYLPCDGSPFSATDYPLLNALLGATTTPDMRGLFVRGYDPTGVNDPNGVGRNIRTSQGDAMRNLTGSVMTKVDMQSATGVFSMSSGNRHSLGGNIVDTSVTLNFSASNQVPVAAEFRPKNINLLYCIKHD